MVSVRPDEAALAGKKLFCVHLHDNDGSGEDQHRLPGTGTADISGLIAPVDPYGL